MKKIRYSQPLAKIWDMYYEAQKKEPITPRDFIYQWIYRDLNNPIYSSTTAYTQSHIFVAEMFYADTLKQFLHLYFIDSSLKDFLMEMPIKDFDGLTSYIKENGELGKAGVLSLQGTKTDENSKISIYSFGIHVPYENKYKGYSFSFHYDFERKELIFSFALGDGRSSFLNLNRYDEFLNNINQNTDLTLKCLQLAVNTIIYMDTFPDCVKEGTPEEIKNEYCRKVFISEKVLEAQSNENKIIRPHFRRGYFKRLTSDFYTKMKGKTVFVKQTMVNGVAKTVYTAENLEEFAD